jgi:hypothetical protein
MMVRGYVVWLLTMRSLVDINLLQLLHRSLLVNHNEIRTMVLDTLYVLTTRSAIPLQDGPLIRMRREAFSEDALQGYTQVLDQIFSSMITNINGQLDIDRETYGVAKKFVMVRHLTLPSLLCSLPHFLPFMCPVL